MEENQTVRKMKIVRVELGRKAFITEIDNTLSTLQQFVNGLIEAFYPFEDDVCMLVNEEGKYNGMEPNRAVYVDGEMVDIIFGPFLVCGLGAEDFQSLTDEQAEKYLKMFLNPERFCIRATPHN